MHSFKFSHHMIPSLLKLIYHHFIPSVFLDAADIWCRFVHLSSQVVHRNVIFNPSLAASDSHLICCLKTGRIPFLSQGRVHVACSCTLTCLKKTTSPERGCYCSQRTTCETWGSGPKVTSCTSRQGGINH